MSIPTENFEKSNKKFDEILKRGEEQVKNGQVVDADIVLAHLRKKYGYLQQK